MQLLLMPHDALKSTQIMTSNDRWRREVMGGMPSLAKPGRIYIRLIYLQFPESTNWSNWFQPGRVLVWSNICCKTRDQHWSLKPLASSNYHLIVGLKYVKMPGKRVTHPAIIFVSFCGSRSGRVQGFRPKNSKTISKWTQCLMYLVVELC